MVRRAVAPEVAWPVVLVTGVDDAFAAQGLVALHSALRHLAPDRPAAVYVIDGGLSTANKARIETCLRAARPSVSVAFLPPDMTRLRAFHVSERLSHATYLRLLAPWLLPPDVVRALYVDADVVVTEDVSPLFDLEMGRHALRAVTDEADGTEGLEFDRLRAELPEHGVRPGALDYFNAGVLLMELPNWRAARISERALTYLERYGARLRWHDQDALNLAALDAWTTLPRKWNNMIGGFSRRFPDLWRDGRPQGILHFAGPRKPWATRRVCAAQTAYLDALLASGWLVSPRDRMRARLLRVRLGLRDGVGRAWRAARVRVGAAGAAAGVEGAAPWLSLAVL